MTGNAGNLPDQIEDASHHPWPIGSILYKIIMRNLDILREH
jgi:hypothetical protein